MTTCGPLLIVFPSLKRWEPVDGRGHEANPPTYGPHLFFFVPRCEALGNPQDALPSGGLQRFKAGDKISTSPQMGGLTTSTHVVVGVPNASHRGTKSESTHNWAHWRRNRCRVEGPQRFTKGNRIRSGPQVGGLATSLVQSSGSPTLQRGGGIPKWPTIGEVATSPLPSRGSQMLQSCGQNRKWPTNGRIGYINFPRAILGGSPTLHNGGQKKSKGPTSRHIGYITPAIYGFPTLERGEDNEKRPTSGRISYSPVTSRGSPTFHRGEQNQK